MSLENIIRRRITGIRPFDELPIDAEVWHEAHNHHRLHRLLHAAGVHRSGIVYGLEVIASRTRPRTVIVAPGIAIDPDGQAVLVAEPTFLEIGDPHQVYIVLSFQRNLDRASAVQVGSGQEYYREVEGRVLQATRELPRTPYLELARLFRSGDDKPIRDAAHQLAPGTDELNLLYRQLAFPFCSVDDRIGELSYVPLGGKGVWNPNRSGLIYLLREARGQSFHLSFDGPRNLRNDNLSAAPLLLYMAGQQGFQPLSKSDQEGVQRYLDANGMLVGEASQGSKEFADAFRSLAASLGATLKPVEANHSLMTAHHVFPAPPPGGQQTGTLEMDSENGILLSTLDYGAAWQGQLVNLNSSNSASSTDPRTRIRNAQEFGVNIIAYTARRRRRRMLARLG